VFGIWCEGRSLLMRDRALATRTIIAVFGIWCQGRSLFHFRRSLIRKNQGRSLFFTQASQLVPSSHCLVFGVKGDMTKNLTQNKLKLYIKI